MKYKVSGTAFCPVEVAVEVEAASEAEALAKAKALVKQSPRDYVVANSEDTSHWHDWMPFAESVPNNQGETRSPKTTETP